MTAPEIALDFSKAIEMIERDERTEGSTALYLDTSNFHKAVTKDSLGNIPNLTMSSLEGYVPARRHTLDEPAV